jgi:hypothetical protein
MGYTNFFVENNLPARPKLEGTKVRTEAPRSSIQAKRNLVLRLFRLIYKKGLGINGYTL